MFTVKVVRGQQEEITACEQVTVGYGPAACSRPTYDDRRLTMWGAEGREGDVVSVDEGLIYVMNQNGRTVATYTLGDVGPRGERKTYDPTEQLVGLKAAYPVDA